MKKLQNYNKKACLNVDDDVLLLKKIQFIKIGKHLLEAVETRILYVEIVKELVPDDDSELNICRNMKRSIFSKCDRLFDESLGKTNNYVAVSEGE